MRWKSSRNLRQRVLLRFPLQVVCVRTALDRGPGPHKADRAPQPGVIVDDREYRRPQPARHEIVETALPRPEGLAPAQLTTHPPVPSQGAGNPVRGGCHFPRAREGRGWRATALHTIALAKYVLSSRSHDAIRMERPYEPLPDCLVGCPRGRINLVRDACSGSARSARCPVVRRRILFLQLSGSVSGRREADWRSAHAGRSAVQGRQFVHWSRQSEGGRCRSGREQEAVLVPAVGRI